jgi:hypothetical protein
LIYTGGIGKPKMKYRDDAHSSRQKRNPRKKYKHIPEEYDDSRENIAFLHDIGLFYSQGAVR